MALKRGTGDFARSRLPDGPGFGRPHPIYFPAFILTGLALSVLGPALSQLRERTGSDIGDIGVLFVGQSLGFIVASFITGRAYDRFAAHRVFAGALATLAVGLALVPSFDSLLALFAVFIVIGAGASGTDVGANTLLIWRMGAGVGRSMNVLHFCFGIGALTAPLLVHTSLTISMRAAALACLGLGLWAAKLPSPVAPSDRLDEHTAGGHGFLIIPASFFLLYVGVEIGFAGWIHTYGQQIEFSDLAATWLTTVYWVAFTAGRLLASLVGQHFRPKMILTAACSLTMVAALVLVAGGGRSWAVWTGAALMGVATAPQFPVMFTYLERRISITGRATSWFVGAAGIGGLAFPWLIGRWFDASGAATLPWSMLLLGGATFTAFGLSNRVLGG